MMAGGCRAGTRRMKTPNMLLAIAAAAASLGAIGGYVLSQSLIQAGRPEAPQEISGRKESEAKRPPAPDRFKTATVRHVDMAFPVEAPPAAAEPPIFGAPKLVRTVRVNPDGSVKLVAPQQ